MKISKSSIIIAVSIIVIAAVFAVLLAISRMGDSEEYNGHEFSFNDGLWTTAVERGGQQYYLDFRYLPSEVENIPLEGDVDERFQNTQVYLTIDPTDERSQDTGYLAIAAVEISRKLAAPFGREVIAACTINETDACSTRPIVTCGERNLSVIYLKNEGEASIIAQENCVTIQGSGEEIVKASTKALYTWLGIIE